MLRAFWRAAPSKGGDMKKRLLFLVICLALMLMTPGRGTLKALRVHHPTTTVTCADGKTA